MAMNILVLAPHTDDSEFGCGGTIAKLARHGARVHVLAFSSCDVPELKQECQQACAILGAQVEVLNFPVRRFNEQRQDILEAMIRFGRKVEPHTVFLPNTDDVHQDHQVVAAEALRAFKRCNLLGYELPWNSYRMESAAYSVLEEEHVAAKIDAMLCYKSQSERPYASGNFIRSLATVRGTAIGTIYAECFQSIRQILP